MRMMERKDFEEKYEKLNDKQGSGAKAIFAREVRGSDR